MNSLKEKLEKYLPEGSVLDIQRLLVQNGIQLKITRSRNSKLGDYRPPQNGDTHRISVNGDLNQYTFLIILLHEIAHAMVRIQYKRKAKPHGNEWKNIYREMIDTFLWKNIFPEDIAIALENYKEKTYASITADIELVKVLRKYDNASDTLITIEDIPANSLFSIDDKRIFRKGDKIRKRYKCYCLTTKNYYLFSPLSRINPLD